MSSRPLPVVALAALVLLAGAGPVVGVGTDGDDSGFDAHDRVFDADASVADASGGVPDATDMISNADDSFAQYKVSLDNVTVRTWLIRNSTVLNATVENVVVRNATTENGSQKNVTLSNVSVGQFALDRARMKNVTARRLVIRNKSILDVPGGSFFDPSVENRTIDRQWTKNDTVSGVVIDRIVVDAAILCGNATLGHRAPGNGSFAPVTGDERPDITVENGTVGEALVMRGDASNWSVESVDRPNVTDLTLPQGCNRG
ncbi:hypothetical protein [Halorussus pelagicus]|uniref:hypothetical protein n=1 Tax=Halorussus pelagicus TaxID=2505977 RepID=UPI000FFB1FAB|nr:hypothetical protein [Halorussus pelagicus]